MRRFEFVGGGSSKFWEISQSGSEVTVHFGRIGTNGQTQTKGHDSWEDASERVRKLVAEKLKEGYQEVAGSGPRPETEPGFRKPPAFPPYELQTLPGDGPVALGDVQLPPGRRLYADVRWAKRVGSITQPVIWATDGRIADAGRLLHSVRPAAAAINLVPLLLQPMDSDPRRPWESGEFSPSDPRPIVLIDAAAELANGWAASLEGDDEELAATVRPFSAKFPGLASAPPLTNRLRDDRDLLEKMRDRRLSLIAAERPADAITAIGWMGAVNIHDDPAPMSAVLRSWEIRWLARVVEIGSDTLLLTVGNPPQDEKTATALAVEHCAFCPDNIWQGPGTLGEYAKTLVGSRTWMFWWD